MASTSCTASAAPIADLAITHMVNVESAAASAVADAALLVDPTCGAAKLVRASIARTEANGGSKERWLASARAGKLTASEVAFAEGVASRKWEEVSANAIAAGDKSPVFAFWTSPAAGQTGVDQLAAFATAHAMHPRIAAPALNLLAYAYAQANNGVTQVDFAKAKTYAEQYAKAYPSANSYDSQAEIAALSGDFAAALASQVKSVDIAGNQASYLDRADAYSRRTRREQITTTLTNALQKLNGADTSKKSLLGEMMVNCNSNMSPCYQLNPTTFMAREADVKWVTGGTKVSDVKIYFFNDDTDMAIATYMDNGTYVVDGRSVEYQTRASSVWMRNDTTGAWTIVHSNYAPAGGAGIPAKP
ncbi:MAG: nuclear transport factor 2 family protein [Gemmatimonadetes bacterium]|nr:nuclear transport factor 2 family protein [Gemmatimonadota bacterium]